MRNAIACAQAPVFTARSALLNSSTYCFISLAIPNQASVQASTASTA